MKRIILFLTVTHILSGCASFLDRSPEDSIGYEDYFKAPQDFESALTGCYDAIQSGNIYGFSLPFFTDIMTTDASPGTTDKEWNNIYDGQKSITGNKYLKNVWAAHYSGISRTNFLLEALDNPEKSSCLSEVEVSRIRGEALFIRSLLYFNLIRLWNNGVPLLLSPIYEASKDQISYKRVAARHIYYQIIEDMTEAGTLLPESYSSNAAENKGRATKGAAYALLADIFASIGNTNKNVNNDIYSTIGIDPGEAGNIVIGYCDSVMRLNIDGKLCYSLINDYDGLFNGNENTAESIFEIQYSSGLEGSSLAGNTLPPPYSLTTWQKSYRPSEDLINDFQSSSSDKRFASTIVYGEDPTSDELMPHRYKSRNEGQGLSSPNNFIVYRLAHIYLLKAEFLNEASHGGQEALDLLNAIRTRAGLETLDYSDKEINTSDGFRSEIRRQFRLEFAMEGRRWFDLYRWNMTKQMNRTKLPIPSSESIYNPSINEIIP